MNHFCDIRKSFLLLIFYFSTSATFAQITKIMGKVTDAETHEPIPFASVYFAGTTIGVSSDFEGNFSLETKTPSDSLIVSYVGYQTQAKYVYRGRFQQIDF